MAQNTIFSGRQFKVYANTDLIHASGVGSFNTVDDVAWKQVDVDSVSFPSFSPVQEFEMRTGSGRVAEFDNVYSNSKRTTTEFSLSGRADAATLPMWVESVTGISSGATDKVVIPTAYSPFSPLRGGAVTANDWHTTLSFYFLAPTATDSYKLSGCVCTSLTLSADMDTAAGRFQFDATFQTQDAVTKGSQAVGSASGINATKLFLSDMAFKTITLTGSVAESSVDALWTSVSFNVEQPTQFLGATGTAGDCEVIARGLPETNFTMSGSIKYDANTDTIIESFRSADSDNAVAIYMATHVIDTASFHASAVGIGFNVLKGKFTSAEVSPDDLAMVNFEVKALDSGSTSVCEVLIA